MKKLVIAVAVTVAVFALTACGSNTENGNMNGGTTGVVETVPVSTPANEVETTEHAYETQYGNTNGNISNDAFAVQDEDYIYYVLPAQLEDDVQLGELTKSDSHGIAKTVLLSGEKLHHLNIADDWIYYISSPDGLIYKIREDGTENTLITSADTESGFIQGYTTQKLSMVEKMTVVGDYIYCRASNADRTKELLRIHVHSGEMERLQQLGALTNGFSVYEGWVYYSIYEDEAWKTFRIRTDGSENTKIADFQIFSVNIVNDKIYYLCEEALGMQIYSMDLDGANNTRIADGITAVKINVAGDWVYFTDTSAIYKIKTDGTERIKLCDFPSSNFVDLNVLEDWVYLTGKGFPMHKVKTDGSELQEVK